MHFVVASVFAILYLLVVRRRLVKLASSDYPLASPETFARWKRLKLKEVHVLLLAAGGPSLAFCISLLWRLPEWLFGALVFLPFLVFGLVAYVVRSEAKVVLKEMEAPQAAVASHAASDHEPTAHEAAKAKCPSCDQIINIAEEKCPYCRASFAAGSPYRLTPL